MVKLEELGMTLEDVDFGSVDAESDPRLGDYFVETPYMNSALKGRKTQILGRKGSGKSALFTQIPTLAHRINPDTSVVLITPDNYAWSALKQYREQGLLIEHAHTNAWKFTLIVEAASALLESEKKWEGDAKEAMNVLRSFLKDNFGDLNTGVLRSAASILKGLSSFNLSAFGFEIGATTERANQILTPAIIESLTALLGDVVREHRVIIALDRLDDSWDGSKESQSLLIGLLKAAKEFNDLLGGHKTANGLRVTVFLRSDIYDILEFDDKDKHRPLEELISWTPRLLMEMVNRRIPDPLKVEDLFESGVMRGSIQPFNYLVKRTFLRPREIIQFLVECQTQAETRLNSLNIAGSESQLSSQVITKDDIRSAEERYSQWKVEDIKQEFKRAFPDFVPLIECFRQQVHRYDSLEELEQMLERRNPDIYRKHGGRYLLEKLFDYSIIGVRVSNQGAARFKSEAPQMTLPSTGAAYVHHSLHKGLLISEKRTSSELPNDDEFAIEGPQGIFEHEEYRS